MLEINVDVKTQLIKRRNREHGEGIAKSSARNQRENSLKNKAINYEIIQTSPCKNTKEIAKEIIV